MSWPRRLWDRLLARGADGATGREIDEELSFHLDRLIEDNVAAGMGPREARRDAMHRFGSLDEARLRGRAVRHRGGGPSFGAELRQAVRTVRRQPGFAAVIVMTLGLGIGATTAIFSLVDSILLKPLPYPDADRLVYLDHEAAGVQLDIELGIAPGIYGIDRQRSETLEEMGFYDPGETTLTGRGEPERVTSAVASSSLLALLGARPALGRVLSDEDDGVGSPPVALLSDRLWTRRYGRDPDVVGQTIQVGGDARQVIGTLPPDFDFVLLPGVDIWLDSERTMDGFGGFGDIYAIARMKPEVRIDDVRRDLQARLADLLDGFEDQRVRQILEDARIQAAPRLLKERVVGNFAETLWILSGAVGFVLLIACANVANLFLLRSETRVREMAVRRALGAGRARLARQALAESFVLSASGGAAGVVIAWAMQRFLILGAPVAIPRAGGTTINATVLGFAVAVSLLAGLCFGSLSVLRPVLPLASQLHDGGRGATTGRRRARGRRALVAAQVALALVLLVGAGLMARSFWHLRSVELGFDETSLLTFHLSLRGAAYREPADAAAFHSRLLDSLEELPGVVSVGAAAELPMEVMLGGNLLYIEGEPVVEGELPPLAGRTRVTEGYFEALHIPLLAGRLLRHSDTVQRTNAVVLNEAAAELYFHGADPIGKRVHTENSIVAEQITWMTIVGVVGNHKQANLIDADPPIFYLPLLGGDFDQPHEMGYAVRISSRPLSLADQVRRAVWDLDPALPIIGLRTMEQAVAASAAPMRFTMVLLAIAAAVAVLLGMVGVYGVMAYVVRQRTAEIGVRMALGARAADVRAMMLREGAAIGAIGLVTGLAASFALVRFMRALLFGVDPLDPATHVGVGLLVFAVVLAATWLPARLASRVDPLVAIRGDRSPLPPV